MTNGFKPLDWVHSTNIYEVNVRQYTAEGTFNAFAKELPRLIDMGVQVLWFMPIYPIGEVNRKGTIGSYYSISDYKKVSSDYGTFDDFKNLVNQAHALGFKIILDWVANHTAWDHVWTKSHPDFFTKDHAGNFRPPFPDWADVIDLNFDNKELWSEMISDMKFWITAVGIDGFRCDMAHLVPLDFWKEARKQLDEIKPLFWLAETEEANYHTVFDATYTWEFLHKMEAFWRKETIMEGLDSVLIKYDTIFPPNALRAFFTSNHDENSHSGSEYERMGDLAKAFAVLCATWNAIPLIYSGQELPNKKRLRFFEKDEIEWTSTVELHDFYKTLLNLHATHPALRAGDPAVITYRITTNEDKNVFSFLRKNGEKEVLVIINLFSADALSVSITDEKVNGNFRNVFSGDSVDISSNKTFDLPASGFLVFEK
ncbi:MAG: alpha-amylase family glycosyl hydrolase [Chitinophagaceae bacterium]